MKNLTMPFSLKAFFCKGHDFGTKTLGFLLMALFFSFAAQAQLVEDTSFDPPESSGLCSLAHDPSLGEIWVYDCSAAQIEHYDTSGNFINAFPFPGEAANDVDLEIAPENLTLGTTSVLAGQLLVLNGETNEVDIYALDPNTGTILGTLNTQFGVSHVVGGGYDPLRDTFFVIQDNVPGSSDENTIAEIDPVSGAVMNSMQITSSFNVSYGDLDISNISGNLFLVSSVENTIVEFTPAMAFVQALNLPATVSGLSGLSLDCATAKAWASNTSGTIFSITGFDCDDLRTTENTLAGVAFYPNPTNGPLTISLGRDHARAIVKITNLLGQIVSYKTYENTDKIETNILGPAGIYLMSIETNEGVAIKRIIKK